VPLVTNARDPDVRVHIASFNTAAATELAIRSARHYADYPFELVVGDSGSSDGSREMLEALKERGWLDLETAREPRSHYEWIDRWVQACPRRFGVFVDSDVEFLASRWLRDMVEAASGADAAFVAAEVLPEDPDYVFYLTGEPMFLAARPAPWLFLVDSEKARSVGASFAPLAAQNDPRPDAVTSYDVGALFFRRLQDAGLHWAEMPRSFLAKVHHYGGLSWKPLSGRKGAKQIAKIVIVRWRLMRLRRRHDGA